ncbi:MAG: cation diffusion facilitator family transporter [Solirubrobacterales bacterium]
MAARSAQGGSRKVVYAALAGNLAIAATKAAAAWYTGSSAMTSEAIHSLVDTGNQALLLYGMWRSQLPADEVHPLGHGRELYFWAFIVALLIFSLGAGMSFYEGITHLAHPVAIANPLVAYGVLGLSLVFEGASWTVAMREFHASKGRSGWLDAVAESKDPSTYTVLFEDSAAVLGLVFAMLGTLGAQMLGRPEMDGWASIGIAVILGATAIFLARESKGLLIGERARPALGRSLCRLASESQGVSDARAVMTIHLAPDQVVAALDLHFDPEMRGREITRASADLEAKIKAAHPEVTKMFLRLR